MIKRRRRSTNNKHKVSNNHNNSKRLTNVEGVRGVHRPRPAPEDGGAGRGGRGAHAHARGPVNPGGSFPEILSRQLLVGILSIIGRLGVVYITLI